MRNMRVGLAIFGMKMNILGNLGMILIDCLKWFSFMYVHFGLEYVPIC